MDKQERPGALPCCNGGHTQLSIHLLLISRHSFETLSSKRPFIALTSCAFMLLPKPTWSTLTARLLAECCKETHPQQRLNIGKGCLLPSKAQQALRCLDKQLPLNVIDLLHNLRHVWDEVPLCAIAPPGRLINDQQIWRADAFFVCWPHLHSMLSDMPCATLGLPATCHPCTDCGRDDVADTSQHGVRESGASTPLQTGWYTMQQHRDELWHLVYPSDEELSR